jgi:hypothetical protein
MAKRKRKNKSSSRKMTDKSQTIFLHYGRHTLQAGFLPDGRLLINAKDTIRVLCAVNGMPTDILDRMPEPVDYDRAFETVLSKVRDSPESKAFGQWLGTEAARFEGNSDTY